MSNTEGLSELNATLKKLSKDAGRFSMSAYIAGGKLVESDAKKSIQEKSPGTMVTRYRNGGGAYSHLAASKGNAPNTDTGALVRGINTEPTKDAVFVGSSLDYARYMEWTNQWLIPALNKNMETIINLQVDAINKSIKANEHNV